MEIKPSDRFVDYITFHLTISSTLAINTCLVYTLIIFLKKYLINLFIWEGQIAGARGKGRGRLPAEQETLYGGGTQNLEIMTWVEGRCLNHWATLRAP